MYWFFNCNNYHSQAIKALVYSAYKFNPHFKPICIWEEPKYSNNELKSWLIQKGVKIFPYCSVLGKKIIHLRNKQDFDYSRCNHPFENIDDLSLGGMWAKADIPLICSKLNIKDKYVLSTDPDCLFLSKFDLKLEPEILAAGPEEEPYREWISGGIYIFNVERCLSDRFKFCRWIVKNYRKTCYAENLVFLDFYGFKNITHIGPDWNYKPYWEKEGDYLISPQDRAIFRACPKLIHFQGIYKPWNNPPMPINTDMKYYCELWKEYVELSDKEDFKFLS